MCGFTGFGLQRSGDAASFAAEHRSMLERMNGTLVHRGPDDEGYCLRAPFGLGFRRLSIIDVAGGHQPIEAPSGDLAVVGNGEVYNFQSLRSDLESRGATFQSGSDIETILHLYREHVPSGGGEADLSAIPRALVGMFAFAVADWRDPDCPRILLGRDRLGIKPLYWCETAEGLFFGSEAKAILAAGVTDREMRREALLDYLVQGYVGGQNSAWVGVQRLPAGSVLSWNPRDGVRIQRYWDLPKDELRGAPREEEVRGLLDQVVEDRLVAEVPLGAFLSGGIDSTAVAHSMKRATGEAPVLCSVGFQEKSHDELGLAKETAGALGAVHHTEILEPDPRAAIDELPWFYDEPLADPSTVPTWLVSKVARQHVTVALSGDGGDEIFGGYRRYLHDLAENRIRRAVGSAGRSVMGAIGRVYPKLDWAPRAFRAKTFLMNTADDPARAYWRSVTHMERDAAASLLAPDLREALGDHDPFDAFEAHYARPEIDCPLFRAQYADFHTWLPDRILAKVDRASMAVSLEVRVPLLDHRFVERFAHSPTTSKVRGGRGKHVLRESLRGQVSDSVLDGVKRGFDTPLAVWIRGPLAEATRDAVEGLPEDWFDRGRLRSTLEAHMSGAVNHDRLLWSLLVLDAWRRRHDVARIGA
ncbi:MAG: asparagine synthase (glutamine-hydrolyzing) [Planctomycetota bacterium]|nr:asparagine synthase (glutamine-hydrolyzing) [Planctomycetota bacterium]